MNNEWKTKKISRTLTHTRKLIKKSEFMIHIIYMWCATVMGDDDDGSRARCGESNATMRRASMHAHSTKDFNFGFNKPQNPNLARNPCQSLHLMERARERQRQKRRRARECSNAWYAFSLCALCKIGFCLISSFGIFLKIIHNEKKQQQNITRSRLFLHKPNKCDVTCFVHAPKALEFV